jgi:hypothetical protein
VEDLLVGVNRRRVERRNGMFEQADINSLIMYTDLCGVMTGPTPDKISLSKRQTCRDTPVRD